jgi:prophage regulatory protein
MEVMAMQNEFLRWPRVRQLTGLSRSTVWRLEKSGQFPARRKLSANSVGWSLIDLQAWMQSRNAAATQETHEVVQ